ncbi:MAG TPA: HAMP domain-containing sensor histidine kinase [Longimicrobiales bacterium]
MRPGTIAVTSTQIRANGFDLLSRLADDLAHEIKNPVHAAVINVELIRRRVASDQVEQTLERVRALESQVGRAHELVDWLLRLLRPSREPARLIAIDQVVLELLPLLESICRLSRVEVCFEPAGNDALVDVSPGAVRHALLNLVTNAIEAMHPGGGRIRISGSSTADEVRLHVADTGPGVPAHAVARIGTPGFSTRPGRAGLGLAVAHALMEEAGGRVTLDSAGGPATGACFVIALPRVVGA